MGPLPSPTPENRAVIRRAVVYIPPRQLCMDMATRFFEQIHCTYWFYSSGEFYRSLDKTIEDGGASASSSWLCALYCIFTMGSMRPENDGSVAWDDHTQKGKTSLEYLSMAKEMSAAAAEEADLDSVRALALLVGIPFLSSLSPA